jgi:hypothetical protein
VAPPPPPGEGSSEPRRDWAKVIEQKPKPDPGEHRAERGQTRTEKKHTTKCAGLERKFARLEDRRTEQGRQGYTLKDREKLDREIREIEDELVRDGCR